MWREPRGHGLLTTLFILHRVPVRGAALSMRVGAEAVREFGEVDLVAVEFGAVDAGEFRLAADGDAAAAAHAGAVHHDGVEGDDGGDVRRAVVAASEIGDGATGTGPAVMTRSTGILLAGGSEGGGRIRR